MRRNEKLSKSLTAIVCSSCQMRFSFATKTRREFFLILTIETFTPLDSTITSSPVSPMSSPSFVLMLHRSFIFCMRILYRKPSRESTEKNIKPGNGPNHDRKRETEARKSIRHSTSRPNEHHHEKRSKNRITANVIDRFENHHLILSPFPVFYLILTIKAREKPGGPRIVLSFVTSSLLSSTH